ncbi:MAG: hypothetical protein ACRDD8_16170 [Bacteroidales bacterium]
MEKLRMKDGFVIFAESQMHLTNLNAKIVVMKEKININGGIILCTEEET